MAREDERPRGPGKGRQWSGTDRHGQGCRQGCRQEGGITLYCYHAFSAARESRGAQIPQSGAVIGSSIFLWDSSAFPSGSSVFLRSWPRRQAPHPSPPRDWHAGQGPLTLRLLVCSNCKDSSPGCLTPASRGEGRALPRPPEQRASRHRRRWEAAGDGGDAGRLPVACRAGRLTAPTGEAYVITHRATYPQLPLPEP